MIQQGKENSFYNRFFRFCGQMEYSSYSYGMVKVKMMILNQLPAELMEAKAQSLDLLSCSLRLLAELAMSRKCFLVSIALFLCYEKCAYEACYFSLTTIGWMRDRTSQPP